MRAWIVMALASTLALASGCTHSVADTRTAATPAVRLSPPALPTFPPYSPSPVLGYIGPDAVDFPSPHMRLLSGWGSMQRGVNMWVVSGLATAYNHEGNAISVGEVCSMEANYEDLTKVRDLVHCYWDKVNRGSYELLGQTGTVARLRCSDGVQFTYDMKSGRLSRTN